MKNNWCVCTNPNCEYAWISKKEKPKCCPRCRQYMKYADEGKLLDLSTPTPPTSPTGMGE